MNDDDARAGVQANTSPRIGRVGLNGDEVRHWIQTAHGLWGVPIRLFERPFSHGGVSDTIYVAVIWPKGSAK